MYSKVIQTSNKIKLDQHHPKWLTSKRIAVSITSDEIKIGKRMIPMKALEDIEFYSYKSFLFFNMYSIFSFKYNNEYFQIGVTNNEKNFLQTYLTNYETHESPVRAQDIIYSLVFLLAIVCPIYLAFN